jgi:hypothetical protein
MLERSVETTVGNTTVSTLNPADTLLHLAYHTAHSGGHRLVWLKDVERACMTPKLDWHEVIHRARRDGIALALAVVLARVSRVTGFEQCPPAVALRPARRTAWGWFAAGVERWSPAPIFPDDRFSGQIAFKNTRRSSPASIAAAVGSLKVRRAHALDVSDNPLYVEAGGSSARAAYLRAIEGAREP